MQLNVKLSELKKQEYRHSSAVSSVVKCGYARIPCGLTTLHWSTSSRLFPPSPLLSTVNQYDSSWFLPCGGSQNFMLPQCTSHGSSLHLANSEPSWMCQTPNLHLTMHFSQSRIIGAYMLEKNPLKLKLKPFTNF